MAARSCREAGTDGGRRLPPKQKSFANAQLVTENEDEVADGAYGRLRDVVRGCLEAIEAKHMALASCPISDAEHPAVHYDKAGLE